MTIPLAVFLIPYLLFLVVYLVFFFFNIYHLYRFPVGKSAGLVITILYILGTVAILGISGVVILRYDWMMPLQVERIMENIFPSQIMKTL